MLELAAQVARFTFEVEGLSHELRVVGFQGQEEISRPFSFQLELASTHSELAFEQVLDQPGVLTLLGRDEPRYLHGLVRRFEQGDEGDRFTTYYATLVPKLWHLSYRYNCRIFQEMSAPEIIQKILEEAGMSADDYELRLDAGAPRHPRREYCVQYRESELNFISRLMEEEGIFYFFEHSPEKHLLVLGDSPSAHRPIAGAETVPFHKRTGTVAPEEHVFRFQYREDVRPGQTVLQDFNFKKPKPTLNLEVTQAADRFTELEIYDYPGAYQAPEVGKAWAEVRLQAHQATRKQGTGESNCPRLAPGAQLTLSDHPREDFNQAYLLRRVEHSGRQPQVLEETASGEGARYGNTFSALPADMPYRPLRETPRPTVAGTQTAIVVGPKGEEIYTDEHGRIKVQFHWDRKGKYDERSSCWVRVSQLWAGAGWGGMVVPRIGQEVIVDFLEGDPDRPLVTGRVYNAQQRPPYELPASGRVSGLKSNSTPGGGGYNELSMDDTKGKEKVTVHAQYDMSTTVEHDQATTVHNNRTATVDVDDTETVGSNQTLKVGANQSLDVGSDQATSVHNNRTATIDVDDTETVGGKQTVTIGANQALQVGNNQTTTVENNQNLTVGNNQTTTVTARQTLNVGSDQSHSISGNCTTTIGAAEKHTVGANQTLVIQGVRSTSVAAHDQLVVTGSLTITVAGPISITSDTSISFNVAASSITLDPSGVSILAPKINLNS
jgi:type VI secretion system secreted protein VgrG